MAVQVTDFLDRLPNKWQPKSTAQKLALACPADVLLFGGAAGSLKALCTTTYVPTPAGWSTLADLHVGDEVLTPAGDVTKIVEESPIYLNKRCFEITFDNGEKVIAADDHKWVTLTESERTQIHRRTPEFRAKRRACRPKRGAGKKPWLSTRNSARAILQSSSLLKVPAGTVRTTEDISKSQLGHDGRPNHSVPVTAPIELPHVDLPVDPYVLGAWLGDGTSANGGITGIDPEIINEIRGAGFEVTDSPTEATQHYVKRLMPLLRQLSVLKNKHIPAAYLRSSKSQRIALVQGLMDTDGTVRHDCRFDNTNFAIAYGMQELLLSLGVKANIETSRAILYGKDCGPLYSISFMPNFTAFRLPRKANAQPVRRRLTTTRRYITSVREVPTVPTKCIAVADDCHLFLVSRSFIPTHNSETLLVDAIKYYQRPKFNGIIFRKTYPEIEFLIDRTRDLYSHTGGTFYESSRQWRWPWGATLEFRHLDKDKDVYKHMGPEYQFVGFDESTHQKEFVVRYLLNSRMRSTEGIPLRMRLATNPGNVGHGYHKEIFHGPKCTHCILEANPTDPKWLPGSRKPFTLYSDARWASDKRLMEHTTMFIPGRVRDHNLFGEQGGEYARRLKGLPQQLVQALLEGCWEAFEGQFFDCFDFNTHVVKRTSVENKDWWPYWVGIDYAFGHAAAAYLFTKSPSGIVYVLDEYIIHRRKAVDFALDLKKMWGHYRIKAWYMGPDTFDHDGTDDFSKAELMSQATEIYFDKAYNERVSGAMLIYTLLSDYKLFICENCELLPKALQTRVHADKNAEDIEKVKTEDEDDAYDGFRYGVASAINPIEKPQNEILQEKFENEWSQDPTVAMIQYQMYMQGQQNQNRPINYRQGKGSTSKPMNPMFFGNNPPRTGGEGVN